MAVIKRNQHLAKTGTVLRPEEHADDSAGPRGRDSNASTSMTVVDHAESNIYGIRKFQNSKVVEVETRVSRAFEHFAQIRSNIAVFLIDDQSIFI